MRVYMNITIFKKIKIRNVGQLIKNRHGKVCTVKIWVGTEKKFCCKINMQAFCLHVCLFSLTDCMYIISILLVAISFLFQHSVTVLEMKRFAGQHNLHTMEGYYFSWICCLPFVKHSMTAYLGAEGDGFHKFICNSKLHKTLFSFCCCLFHTELDRAKLNWHDAGLSEVFFAQIQ